MVNFTNNLTKVSSATDSKLTTDTTIDIERFSDYASTHNLFAVVITWIGSVLTIDGMFFGDATTQAGFSVFEHINDCTVPYTFKNAGTKDEWEAYVRDVDLSGKKLYLVKASRDLKPSYEVSALSSAFETSTFEDRFWDEDDLCYAIFTKEAALDFITPDKEMAS